MNKRGFTLVELLAVIVILSLLGLLASNSITKITRNSKEELYDTQIKLIEAAAESWGADNLDALPETGNSIYITLRDLKSYGLLEDSIINPKTNKEFSNNMCIKIYSEENEHGLVNVTYEVEADNKVSCESFYNYDFEVAEYINDASYPWTFNDGIYKSSNKSHSTSSNITFNFSIEQKATLNFEWSVSSESVSFDYVYYTIKKDGVTLSGTGLGTKIGGASYGTAESSLTYLSVSKELEPGEYQLIFTYTKDSSVSSGTDTAYIKNIFVNY